MAGVLLVAIGVMLATMRSRGWKFGVVVALGWLVASGALAAGIVAISVLVNTRNGPPGPSLEFGLQVAAAAPALALVGMGMVQIALARERAANS